MPPAREPNHRPETGREFEQRIEKLLEARFPHCYLPGVPVFPSDEAMKLDIMANELDFILHLKKGDTHTLLVIECKACRVTGDHDGKGRGAFSRPATSSPWLAHYQDGGKPFEKDIKKQLRAQRRALLTNLEPIEGVVRVYAVVVCSQAEGLDREPGFVVAEDPSILEMTLIREDRFGQFLEKLLESATPFRVQQSEILRRIRLGQPVPALGHPEIYNAIEYCRRCRTFIDSEIFHHLDFKHERWAINGSAGMGKSVLLVYATMVLITDRYIDTLKGELRVLQKFTRATEVGLPPLEKRHVWVVSHTDKQRKMLEQMFARFNELYGAIDPYIETRRVKPQFRIFDEITAIDDCNVLLVDEAHDLGPEWEARVREWHVKAPGNYLVIACDRHQKLRLSNDNARMITGLNFRLCTTKLKRNYRNPFPAYAGSLGMLFRWFTSSGPKILPNDDELLDAFGFAEVFKETSDRLLLRSRNDAHPANNWSHVLSHFPTVAAGYQQLAEFPLRKEQVLWIRFAPEEVGFNYENLQRWSYHSVHSADAPDLLDKYVKGQEFPVVVIEGVPRMFSWAEVSRAHPNDLARARTEMWQARRLVYLAASRTNVFLYFILSADTPADVVEEFRLMFTQLGHHLEQPSPSGTLWELRVSKLGETETLDDYLDAIEAEAVVETATPEPVVVTPALPALPIKPEVISAPAPQPAPPPAPVLAPPKPEAVQPARSPLAPQPQPSPVASPGAAVSSPAPSGPVPVLPPAASPAQPTAAPHKPAMATVASLAAEFRMPVAMATKILQGKFGKLSDSTLVIRDGALRMLSRATPVAPKFVPPPQPPSVTFNSFADQLDGQMQKAVAASNAPKHNPPKP